MRVMKLPKRRSKMVSGNPRGSVTGMVTTSDGPGDSGLDWQGDGVDVETETVNDDGRRRYRWTLYDHARVVRTGVCRTRRGARLASGCARLMYRALTWPAPEDPPPAT